MITIEIFFSFAILVLSTAFTIYMILKTTYPAKGIKVVTNICKKRITFPEALEELKKGRRIKRISEYGGFLKMTKEAHGYKEEIFAKYRVSQNKPEEGYISFSLEDVLAEDWIIDE